MWIKNRDLIKIYKKKKGKEKKPTLLNYTVFMKYNIFDRVKVHPKRSAEYDGFFLLARELTSY